jgi:hypothetical protein
LLRETPMQGRIRISLEREPSFFEAARMEGDRHHTGVVRDPAGGRILAMCSRSVREVFVNGEAVRLGYLSQLRIAPAARRWTRTLLRAGFDRMRSLRAADEAPFDITAVIADNRPARRLLEAGLPGLPRYRPVERLLTLLLPVGTARQPAGVTIDGGSAGRAAEILACLERNNRRHQFAPRWGADDFPMPGLGWDGFRLAVRGDRVIGCLALWDQRGFKQAVVRGYDARLGFWRPLLNLLGAGLPSVGTALPVAFASHVAVDGDRAEVFTDLLEAVLREAREHGCRWLAVGLAAPHPLVEVVRRRFKPRQYESLLYVVHEPEAAIRLDSRLPHVEVALL